MDKRAIKLTKHFGISADAAEKLVAAGFATPRQIKRARVADLEKVIGRPATKLAREKVRA